MKLQGTITEFDPTVRTGKIEDVVGKFHLIQPNSLRKKVKLKLGDKVQLTTWNLSNGPTASDVVPV
jgi:translation initiation factor IF-1